MYTPLRYDNPTISRDITSELLRCAGEYPVVTILGPRQSGKTTLARMTFPNRPYFSLEDPDVRAVAEADPRGFLNQTKMGVILDEVQRLPALLSYIQTIVDESRDPGRFVLTGSHQPRLHEAISQSLAGRTAMLTLWPFSLSELRHYKSTWEPFELQPFFANIRKRVVKSPKILFTDVGFAAFLLGIRSPEQAFRDPLRGNLYENLVISEVVKGALNRGIRPEIYFYRDSHGNEVDLLIRECGRMTPVEIKSASTFSPHFVKTLEGLRAVVPDSLEPGYVLFNGEQKVCIRGIHALNPLGQGDLWATLTGAPR